MQIERGSKNQYFFCNNNCILYFTDAYFIYKCEKRAPKRKNQASMFRI